MTGPHSLGGRVLLGVVGVAVVSAVVASGATIAGFLVVANQHPIGANRIGRRLLGFLPASLSTDSVVLVLVAVGLLLLLLAVVTALSIAERVLRPVEDLAVAAERMAAGDLTARIAAPSPREVTEIAEVARSFNAMADSLQSSVGTLQRMEATARRFAGDVAHELRTPLTAMTAVTDVLTAHAEGMTPAAAQATDLVVREIGHLDRLVSALVEMSRFDAGTAVLDAELVEVLPALRSTLELRGWTERVHLSVETGLTAPLDLRRFDIVVANLVGNALKYGAAPVELTAARSSGLLVVEVLDRGPGIAPADLPHVFERFYKADAARSRSDGSGLGLAIARENALLHGGELSVVNRPDGGAAFRLVLPGDA